MDHLQSEDNNRGHLYQESDRFLNESKNLGNLSSNSFEETNDIFKRNIELRGQWSNKIEFFLAIMGYTVGIGSVWRFPIICSQNGGGAFLVPFFFFLIISGGPLYYMEVCIGQFSGRSAGHAFGFCPILKGLGFLQVSLCLMVVWYIVFVSVWIYYYLYSSFFSVLPWTTCNNTWNTPHCRTESGLSALDYSENSTYLNTVNAILQNKTKYTSPSFEFWEYRVIGRSSGLEEFGQIQPHLVICLVLSWTFTVLAVIKGTRTLGKIPGLVGWLKSDIIFATIFISPEHNVLKVVYVSATMPFLLLGIIFIRGLWLEGSTDGIKYFMTPDFSYLLKQSTWLEAALQVFYSLGPTWGGVITMASYNRFHEKTFWSSTLCVACSGFTSFFNGLVVFTILGFMAKQLGTTVEQLASESGTGLVFVAFPTAISKMPLPQFWSVLFFIMLVTVTFDSIFGMFETVTSAIIDMFPAKLMSKRIYVNICLGLFLTTTALPLCFNGGIYILQLLDWYAPRYALLLGSILECVAVFWIYGIDRFCSDIVLMTGRKTSSLLRVTWSIVTPVFLIICFCLTSIQFDSPDYGDGYVYKTGAIAVGICLGLLPIVGMVFAGIFVLLRNKGSFLERVRSSLHPDSTWRPNDETVVRDYVTRPYRYPQSIKKRLLVDLKGRTDDL